MIGWLVFGGYLAVWLLYGWRLTVHLLDFQVRESLSSYSTLYRGRDGAKEAADEWLGMYLAAGFGLAMIWPIVAPVRGVYRVLGGTGLFKTPVEAEYAERQELEQLRALAREHNLPMPSPGGGAS